MTATSHPGSARDAVEAVLALAQADRLDEAEALCRQHLAASRDDVNLVASLGALLIRRGRYDEARQTLQRAIELEPKFAKPHEDLGALYLATGRPADAIAPFETAIGLEPRQASAYYGLATALERSGRGAEAEAARQRFLARSPGSKALAEAAKLRQAGHSDRAEALCGEILAKEPRNIHAMRLLAKICADSQRDAPAEALLRRIISIAPDFLPAYKDLVWLFLERSRFHDAVTMLEKAVAISPDAAELHQALADTLSIVGRSAAALAAYDKVLELQPDSPRALLGRGHMSRILGRREDSIAAYRRCSAVRPDVGDAWWSLSTIRGLTFTDSERATMQQQLAAADPGSDAAIALQFALARACEKEQDYDQAWAHYAAANEAKRRTVAYDPVELEAQHDARLRVFGEVLTRETAPAAAGRTVRPIFITGVPRSGSTLVEQILACHSEVEGCGELPYVIMLAANPGRDREGGTHYPDVAAELSADDWQALGDEYLRLSLAHRAGKTSCFTDKMPANFGHLGFIRRMLPDAVFIDARRNALDTCVANYRQLFAQGKNQSYDLLELGEYYLEYLRVMRHWDKLMPGRILTVHYEDVVRDLEGQVRRLLAHCGLPFETSCLRFHENERQVNTASAEQVREPIYGDAVGYWKHYEPKLDLLKEILAPALRADT
ncbi:MAG: sulfotransferase [Woeseiaceae bacterium]|nr:sulfotransferase [Woeseiaceae bacterium]